MEKDWKEKKTDIKCRNSHTDNSKAFIVCSDSGVTARSVAILGSNFTSWCYVECKFYRRGIDNLRV